MMLAHETCCNLSLQEPNMKAHFKSLHKTLCKEYQDRYWHIAHNYRQGDTEPNEYFVAMMLLVSKRTQITDDVTRKHLFMNAANNAFYEYLLQEMPETFADMIEIALIEGRITRSLNERRQRDLAALQPRPENPLVASAIAVQAAQTPLTAPSDIGLVTGCQPARQLAHQAALTDAAADFISRFEKLSINDANTVMSILRAQLAGHNPAASHL
ncbi:hypothetical protein BGZ94_003673 [Podila epigama]|nr:hypothetical protein BGZ94_003673 [Podila epigama]